MPPAQFFCHWNEANIAEVQDKSLIIQTIEHREDITYQWSLFKECLLKHSYIFWEKTVDYEVFLKIYG